MRLSVTGEGRHPDEGAAALHEGTTLAERVGRDDIAAEGWREISWVQFLRARYERAEAQQIDNPALDELVGFAELSPAAS